MDCPTEYAYLKKAWPKSIVKEYQHESIIGFTTKQARFFPIDNSNDIEGCLKILAEDPEAIKEKYGMQQLTGYCQSRIEFYDNQWWVRSPF